MANVTIAPREHATPVEDPAIPEARSLRTGKILDAKRLISAFSFADAHISARIDEGLAGNPSASVFAFQYQDLGSEACARELGRRLPNFSVYARDAAVVNGSEGVWRVPSELPSKDWGPIRSSYWSAPAGGGSHEFILGAIEPFARFFSASRSTQVFVIPIPPAAPVATAA